MIKRICGARLFHFHELSGFDGFTFQEQSRFSEKENAGGSREKHMESCSSCRVIIGLSRVILVICWTLFGDR